MAIVIASTEPCPGGTCPTTYAHPDPDLAYVQGYVVTDPKVLSEFNIPDGETLVVVPNALLADHARKVSA